ncbi:MAG: hypothetical protein WA055_04760 [Candidatus Moraniibacteriota bacterium]
MTDIFETIALTRPEKSPDAFYTNEKIIATFCPDEIFPDTRKEWPIYAGQDDMPLYMDHRRNYLKARNSKCLPNTFETYLSEILNSGKVMILSREENKFVSEIKRKEWGFSAGELAGRGGYEYYLPNGTLFFRITSWVS